MKFEIKSRYRGEVLFEGEFGSLKLCVEAAVSKGANLRAANLSAANLSAANLSAANLSDADLRAADLRAANLSDADLSDADLRAADLSDADLRAANLSDADLSAANLRAANLSAANLSAANLSAANLSDADLRAADLRAANLSAANLRAADLRAANLRAANLSAIRDDVWAVLSAAPSEVPELLKAIEAGKIDGSTYDGECRCLVGTLSKRDKQCKALTQNSSRPAERFFMNIKPGDTPESSQSSKIAAQWVKEWLENVRMLVG